MRIVIAQRGPRNAGKSSTIRSFYKVLREEYPAAVISHEAGGLKDFRAVVTIGDKHIGIESMGDPGHGRQAVSLELFVQLGCAAIICATRTRGDTVGLIESLRSHGYDVIWRDRQRKALDEQSQANQQEARWMLERVQELLVDAKAA